MFRRFLVVQPNPVDAGGLVVVASSTSEDTARVIAIGREKSGARVLDLAGLLSFFGREDLREFVKWAEKHG